MPIFSKLAMLNGITFGPCIQNFTQIAQEMREVRVEIHTCRQWAYLSRRFCRRFGRCYKVTDGQSRSSLLQLAPEVLSVSAVTSPRSMAAALVALWTDCGIRSPVSLCSVSFIHCHFSLYYLVLTFPTLSLSLSLTLLLLRSFRHRPVWSSYISDPGLFVRRERVK